MEGEHAALRLCQNNAMTFENCRVPEENLFAEGNGALIISKAFTWSGPVAAIAAVGVARCFMAGARLAACGFLSIVALKRDFAIGSEDIPKAWVECRAPGGQASA